jgi:hypothetical protein
MLSTESESSFTHGAKTSPRIRRTSSMLMLLSGFGMSVFSSISSSLRSYCEASLKKAMSAA